MLIARSLSDKTGDKIDAERRLTWFQENYQDFRERSKPFRLVTMATDG